MSFNKKKVLKYAGQMDLVSDVMPHPVPASQELPDWYRSAPKTTELKLARSSSFESISLKSCMPFLDPFMTGYLIRLHCDIYVKQSKEGVQINCNPMGTTPSTGVVNATPATFMPLQQRFSDVEGSHLPTPAGHDPHTFDWLIKWGFKAPKNYSLLMTHPLNRVDLPFISATAIMDADNWGLGGSHSFWLKSGFEGFIEEGTPILQVIPIARENWSLEEDASLTKEFQISELKKQSKFTGVYRDKFWVKKSYN